MTVSAVCLALSELERLLLALDASSETEAVRALEQFLRPYSDAKTEAFLKRASPRRPIEAGRTGRQVSQFLPILVAYRSMLSKLAGKNGKEFALLVDFLRQHEHADVSNLISAAEEALSKPRPVKRITSGLPTNEQLVSEYVERLQTVIGDDGFSRVFEPLKSDKKARAQEVVEIAKRLMPAPPAEMDRRKALAAIQNLHLAAKGFDLKLKASRGRSAA